MTEQLPSETKHICDTAEFKAGGVICYACREEGVQDHLCDYECMEALTPPSSNPPGDYDRGLHAGLLHYSKIADDLRERLLRACAYLRQVGDDYPGSSCQKWCHEKADECAADGDNDGR